MKQLLPHIITNLGMTFTHDSPTVERIIHYIMRQFKPTESEPLLIYEVEDLNDYGAEFVSLISLMAIQIQMKTLPKRYLLIWPILILPVTWMNRTMP